MCVCMYQAGYIRAPARAARRDKSSGGYGLGLAIAARILQRHKGSIRVENCAPSGACFILRWPV